VVSIVQAEVLSSSSWSGSFSSNVTAGNTVFLFAFQYTSSGATMGSSAPTFGGSGVSGAVKLLEKQGAGSDNTVYGAIWMLPDLAGGAASCGLTNSGGIVDSYVGLIGIEASGLGASPVLDAASPNPETGTNNSGSPSSGATGDTVSAPDIILGMAVEYGTTLTLPGGAWSGLQTISEFTAAGWQIASGSGSPYTYTASGAGASWVAGVAAVTAGTTNVTGTFGTAMAPMGLAFTGAETVSGHASLAMAPMGLAFSGEETGASVTGMFSMAMAPMRLRFSQRGPAAGGYVPDSDEAREFKRWLLWDL